MNKIKMTKEQKKGFEVLVRERAIARCAFSQASEMCHDTEARLWKKVQKIWSNATHMEYPLSGDWTVTVCEKDEKKPVIK